MGNQGGEVVYCHVFLQQFSGSYPTAIFLQFIFPATILPYRILQPFFRNHFLAVMFVSVSWKIFLMPFSHRTFLRSCFCSHFLTAMFLQPSFWSRFSHSHFLTAISPKPFFPYTFTAVMFLQPFYVFDVSHYMFYKISNFFHGTLTAAIFSQQFFQQPFSGSRVSASFLQPLS